MTNGFTLTRTNRDCGIVAISNLLGIPYDTVYQTAHKTGYMVCSNGMTNSGRINSTLQELGYRAVTVHKDYVERRRFTGLYAYKHGSDGSGHIVPVVGGHIYDYDGSIRPLVKKGRAPSYEAYMVVIKDTETGV